MLFRSCRFLSCIVDTLDLPVQVHNGRAEALHLKVDRVVARAFAPLDRLLGFAEPYLKSGAIGLFLKGEGLDAERALAEKLWSFESQCFPSRSDPRGRIIEIRGLKHV